MAKLSPPPPSDVWDDTIARLPGAHILQTAEWAQVKARVGWQAYHLLWCGSPQTPQLYINQWPEDIPVRAAALILQRSIALGGFSARLRVLYSPKGPLLDWEDPQLSRQVIADLQAFAKRQGAIFIKIDPDVRLSSRALASEEDISDASGRSIQEQLTAKGWIYSQDQIQFRNTALLDLTRDEDRILADMKPKTRYNIRLAERKGVTIRAGIPADYSLLYRMYAETSLRDRFAIRDEAYYQHVWHTFTRVDAPNKHTPHAQALIAEVDGAAVAALVLFLFAAKAWYLYGMSRDVHREKMPNYLLQWEAIRRAKTAGCQVYDLWGAPEVLNESDPLWGVYRFKEGLGSCLTRYLGAWDYPCQPVVYKLYTQTLPRLLNMLRRQGQARTREMVG